MRVYRHCAGTFGTATQWMAFIDIEEIFESGQLTAIQPNAALRSQNAFLYSVLSSHDDRPIFIT